MTPLRFVIVDMDAEDGPLFWSNEDGWVGWGTESIAEYTATETEKTPYLPLGAHGSKNVKWVSRKAARELLELIKS